ncbi:DUF1059 domain-containing protein [Jatrophihabitans sp. DSM 45814]
MAIRILECRTLIPDSSCKLMFVGDEGEVEAAFREHASSSHGGTAQVTAEKLKDELQTAIIITQDEAYLGDRFTRPNDTTFSFPGPGFVLRRFPATHGAVQLGCTCLGSGTCLVSLTGSVAKCSDGTCSGCGWSTTIEGFAPEELQKLPQFDT